MRTGYSAIREVFESRDAVKDLRTAAFVVAIEKIALAYREMASSAPYPPRGGRGGTRGRTSGVQRP